MNEFLARPAECLGGPRDGETVEYDVDFLDRPITGQIIPIQGVGCYRLILKPDPHWIWVPATY